MSLTDSSLRRPVTTLMVFLCFVVVGAISAKLLPMEFFPDLDAPFVGVDIPYPGSTPEEIEREITKPAEEVLATISGIKRMESNSGENGAFIFLRFDWGIDANVKALEAKETFSFEVAQTRGIRYGVDYELGDLVNVVNPYTEESATHQIVAVTVTKERGKPEQIDVETEEV